MLTGNILTPDGWIHGSLDSENGRITTLDPANSEAEAVAVAHKMDLVVVTQAVLVVLEASNP